MPRAWRARTHATPPAMLMVALSDHGLLLIEDSRFRLVIERDSQDYRSLRLLISFPFRAEVSCFDYDTFDTRSISRDDFENNEPTMPVSLN